MKLNNPFNRDELLSQIEEKIESEENEDIKREIEELKGELQELKLFEEEKKKKSEILNLRRREKRRLEKAEKIASLMPPIREKYSKEMEELFDLYAIKYPNLTPTKILAKLNEMEKAYLSFAQPNRYKTWSESLEDNYKLFLLCLRGEVES